MISTLIVGFAVMAAVAFTSQGLNIYKYEADRLLMNKDIRRFTQQMASDAAAANCFYIYPNFQTLTASGTDAAVTAAGAGDYLVLVTTTCDATTGATKISKIVGYYRVQTDTTTNVGTVYRYSISFSPVQSWPAQFSDLLTAQVPPSTQGTHSVFEQAVIGQATDGVSYQKLFYDFLTNGVMVKGQVQDWINANYKRAIDTYNLTIAPHG